eukprot:g1198.t1
MSGGDESVELSLLTPEGDASTWTAQEVTQQLGQLKLSKDYAQLFVANNLNGEDCISMGQLACEGAVGKGIVMDRLEKMKIASVGDQLKLLRFFVACVPGATTHLSQRRKASDAVADTARGALRSAASVINPLRQQRRGGGFKPAQLERSSAAAAEFSFGNPAIEDNSAMRLPRGSGKRQSLRVPRWSIMEPGSTAAEVRPPEFVSWLGAFLSALEGWVVHFKLMGIVLAFAVAFECFMYLYAAGKSDIFLIIAIIPHQLGNPVLCVAMYWILTEHCPKDKKLSIESFKKIAYYTFCIGVFVGICRLFGGVKAFRWNMGAGSLTVIVFSFLIAHAIINFLDHGLNNKTVDSKIRNGVGYTLVLPWASATMLDTFFRMVGRDETPTGRTFVLVLWSLFLVLVYLQARLCAKRCAPYQSIPILVLPMQLVGDLFTEMVFIEFNVKQYQFWLIMLFDVFLLIMRDADLWDDFAEFVQKKSGKIGRLLLLVAELFAGPDMASIGHVEGHANAQKRLDHWDDEPTEKEIVTVKRELTENCIVSEILASLILCVVLATDSFMDKICPYSTPNATATNITLVANGTNATNITLVAWVPPDNSTKSYSLIAPQFDSDQRLAAIAVYVVMLVCQIIGIFISHQIIRHRNSFEAKLRNMKSAAALVAGRNHAPPQLDAGHSWHFFLSHCQGTAGDAVYSLCLELEAKSFSVWYDNRAEDLTSQGMKEGVAGSAVFVLFLSEGIMSRPFIREALRLRKKVILFHEQDARFHAVNFGAEKDAAPDDLKHLFDDIESIAWRRRKFERQAVLNECMRRAGTAYEQYFAQCSENEKRDPALVRPKRRAERRVSVMSPHSLWVKDRFFW